MGATAIRSGGSSGRTAFGAAARSGQSGAEPVIVIGERLVIKLGSGSDGSRLIGGAITRSSTTPPTTPTAWTFGAVGIGGIFDLSVCLNEVFVNQCGFVQRLARRWNPIPRFAGCTWGFLGVQTIEEVIGKATLVAVKDGGGLHRPFRPNWTILADGALVLVATSPWAILTSSGGLHCGRGHISRAAIPSGRGLFAARAISAGTVVAGAFFCWTIRS